MAMCAHQPKHARGQCPSQKVAKEFSHAPDFKKRPEGGKGGQP